MYICVHNPSLSLETIWLLERSPGTRRRESAVRPWRTGRGGGRFKKEFRFLAPRHLFVLDAAEALWRLDPDNFTGRFFKAYSGDLIIRQPSLTGEVFKLQPLVRVRFKGKTCIPRDFCKNIVANCA